MASTITTIDVAIPTHESASVLGTTLDHLARSEEASSIEIECLRIIDDESEDDTCAIATDRTDEYGWSLDIVSEACSLPAARERAIERVETEWFLFLDDDARIEEDYLEAHASAIAPRIGALQGRKTSQTTTADPEPTVDTTTERHPSAWVHHRSFRGGTHATLVRHAAAAGVKFPADLTVWEDQYLRRHIESQGYLWVFNHQARFAHRTQNPRSQGWTEGYLQGKYDLRPGWHVALGIPNAVISESSTWSAVAQFAGYTVGRVIGSIG